MDALREFMKEDFDKATEEGRKSETVKNIKQLMKNMKWTAEQAMDALGIKGKKRARYISML